MFAWAQNRHIITGWYGVGSAIHSLLQVRGQQGEALLPRLFEQSRLFRLIIDEVEKTLLLVDLDIARDYASLVPEEGVRDTIFPMIEEELALTREMVLESVRRQRDWRPLPRIPPGARRPASHH